MKQRQLYSVQYTCIYMYMLFRHPLCRCVCVFLFAAVHYPTPPSHLPSPPSLPHYPTPTPLSFLPTLTTSLPHTHPTLLPPHPHYLTTPHPPQSPPLPTSLPHYLTIPHPSHSHLHREVVCGECPVTVASTHGLRCQSTVQWHTDDWPHHLR